MEDFTYHFRSDKKKDDDSKSPKSEFKKYRRIIIAVVCVLALVFLLSDAFYTIGEQENAVVTTFGVAQTETSPGLHLKFPFIQKAEKVDMTIKSLTIGYDQYSGQAKPEESLMITSDYNFVNVDFFLEYRVTDPVKYLYHSQDATAILKTLAQSYIRDTIGLYPVDDVITSGKAQIQAEIRDKLSARLETEDLGVQLVNLTIQDAEPPTAEVLAAFNEVENAKQGKETALNNANKYRSEQLPAAEAEADKIIKQAEATKTGRINEANGQVSRFLAMYEEYALFPAVTKQRMYYEAMEKLLPGLQVVIVDESGNQMNMFQIGGNAGEEVPVQ